MAGSRPRGQNNQALHLCHRPIRASILDQTSSELPVANTRWLNACAVCNAARCCALGTCVVAVVRHRLLLARCRVSSARSHVSLRQHPRLARCPVDHSRFSTQHRATRFRVPFYLVVATRSTCRLHITASRRIGHDDYSPRTGSDVSRTLSSSLTTIRSSSSGSSAYSEKSDTADASSGPNRRGPRPEFRRG